jgi:hypothetical protein
MLKGTNGLPDPSTRRNFVTPAANPVDLVMSPQGELFYPDFDGGTIRRIQYVGTGTITCPKGEFKADYFSSIDLSGSPALQQCEPSISYDWSTNSPAPVRQPTTSRYAGLEPTRSAPASTASRRRPTTACVSGSTANR